MLVHAGANMEVVDKDGYNALAAARENNPDVEKALIRAGAR